MKQAYPGDQPKATDPVVTAPSDQSTDKPAPKPVDPRGPEQIKWPRGLNFGNVVLLVSALAAILVGILALFHAEL